MPKILNTEIVAQTKIFKIERLDLRFDNGQTVQYERIVGSSQGAVLIVPMIDDNTVLLIREYAAGMDRYELALPKGNIEKSETILESANREMMEEVGYGANDLEHIKTMSVSPGYLSHRTHVVLAQDLYEKRLEGDEPEPLEVIPWKLNQLEKLFNHQECTEARSIAALYMVRDRLEI
jgi:ADP-ribose diphosphatase